MFLREANFPVIVAKKFALNRLIFQTTLALMNKPFTEKEDSSRSNSDDDLGKNKKSKTKGKKDDDKEGEKDSDKDDKEGKKDGKEKDDDEAEEEDEDGKDGLYCFLEEVEDRKDILVIVY